MSVEEAEREVHKAWASTYSAEAISEAVERSSDRRLSYRVHVLIGRLFFRGIYFRQKGKLAWVKLLAENRGVILRLIIEALEARREARRMPEATSPVPDPEVNT